MSDDWASVTKIGSKTRGGGASQRETVVRSNAALNAAKRSGSAISTEKKYATGNAAKGSGSGSGQFLTKVDRSDDIIKPKTVGSDVGDAIKKGRETSDPKLTQAELAKLCSKPASLIQQYEKGTATPDEGTINAMQRVLGVQLRGKNIGQPTKAAAAAKKREAQPK
jgi:putative transcription factor